MLLGDGGTEYDHIGRGAETGNSALQGYNGGPVALLGLELGVKEITGANVPALHP